MKALEYLKKEREIKKHCADVAWSYYDKSIDEAIKELEDCAKSENLKICKICSGSGKEYYEHIGVIPYPSGLPNHYRVDPKRIVTKKSKECHRCKGLCYVKENIEDNIEYQKYLELKNKFKDEL